MNIQLRVETETKFGIERVCLYLGDAYVTSMEVNPQYRPGLPREQVALESWARRLSGLLDGDYEWMRP